MNPNKALWEKGDFTEIAGFMRQSGEVLVKSLGITTPMRIASRVGSVGRFGASFSRCASCVENSRRLTSWRGLTSRCVAMMDQLSAEIFSRSSSGFTGLVM